MTIRQEKIVWLVTLGLVIFGCLVLLGPKEDQETNQAVEAREGVK